MFCSALYRYKLLGGPEGIEGNFQLAFGKTKKKRFEKVTSVPPIEEQPKPKKPKLEEE